MIGQAETTRRDRCQFGRGDELFKSLCDAFARLGLTLSGRSKTLKEDVLYAVHRQGHPTRATRRPLMTGDVIGQ